MASGGEQVEASREPTATKPSRLPKQAVGPVEAIWLALACRADDISGDAMAGGETENHARLKTLALAWAQANGLPICAPEVRIPRCGFRADVAACGRGRDGRTAVFECKQARADLLKDAHAEAAVRARLRELSERRVKLEELFATHRPDLRRGESLFPEFDAWDFSGLEHRTYRAVLSELTTVQARIVRGTKFSRMFRYRCADLLYLVAEEGLFAAAELPAGWGVLQRRGDQLELSRPSVLLDATLGQRRALLEAIALAGTRAVNRAAGIALQREEGGMRANDRGEDVAAPPETE